MPNGVARRVEAIVAEQLGLRPEDVAPDVSLRDDLAADSIDMLELTAAIEDDLGLTVPERLLDEVRTVGELVSATLKLVRARRAATEPGLLDEAPVRMRARITPAAERRRAVVSHGGLLTPYVLQQLLDAALYAGPGATVAVTLDAEASSAAVGRVLSVLRPLEVARGIVVDVQREDGVPAPRRRARVRPG